MIDGRQKTIAQTTQLHGVGLHSGNTIRLELLPAPAGSGIVFQRIDSPEAAPVVAHPYNISATELSTTVGTGASAVATVEHLMAALVGLGIDNVLVRVDGPEVPILDGSSAPFVDRITEAGVASLDKAKQPLIVRKPFEVSDGERLMRVEPATDLSFHCSIDYDWSAVGRQSIDFRFSPKAFLNLCHSRTFCHIREVENMRAVGLAQGGSLENAVVVTDDGIMNEEGLRSQDEFVRHKLLDCVGDLGLLGAPLIGRITLRKPGHSLHAKFMTELLRRRSEYLTVATPERQREARETAWADNMVAMSAAFSS